MRLTTIRTFIVAVAIAWLSGANASTTCQQTIYGQLCTSQINFDRFAQTAYQTQYQTQWCWAASISMIFGYYGYQVPQPRIVSEAYGNIVNMPGQSYQIAQSLSRTWKDDMQRVFNSYLSGIYDAQFGIATLDNISLINELDQNRPFIIGTNGHAVVATAMQYYPSAYGPPTVVSMGVFDPWPGRGARLLSIAESTPITSGGTLRFIATVNIQAPSSSYMPSTPSTTDTWPGGCTIGLANQPTDPAWYLMLVGTVIVLRVRRSTKINA